MNNLENNIEKILQEIHKKNQTIWFTVLFGMIGLVGFSFLAYSFGFIDPVPVVDPAIADKITMFTILGFLIISFYIKRSALTISKIIEKAKTSVMPINKDLWQIENENKNLELLASAIQIISRRRLIVWFMADLIIIATVINFILAPVLNSFFIYCIVAFYSLAINFPSYKFFIRIYTYIYENN